jgi:hypothetical protein
MDVDLLDKILHLPLVAMVGRFVCLGDERACLVQVLFDLSLQSWRGHGASEGCSVIHLPRMVHFMFGVVHDLQALWVWAIGRLKRTGLDPCGQE